MPPKKLSVADFPAVAVPDGFVFGNIDTPAKDAEGSEDADNDADAGVEVEGADADEGVETDGAAAPEEGGD